MKAKTILLAAVVSSGVFMSCATADGGRGILSTNPVSVATRNAGSGGAIGGIGAADGRIGNGQLSITQTDVPAIANLDPALRRAVTKAAAAAAERGVTVQITSGWRSREYQQRLLDEAVEKYGSLREAKKWVATPDASSHTRGKAVDIGPTEAAYWMRDHGAAYGLCQTYANEVWHYQLATTPRDTCPPPSADAGE